MEETGWKEEADCLLRDRTERTGKPCRRSRMERGSKPTQENARREKQVRRREAGQMKHD